MKNKRFDGFSINMFLDEDNEWIAHFMEMSNISACGDTIEEALNELEVAWECAKESYKKHNELIPIAPSQKQYSGHFNVRVDKRLHKNLAQEAAIAGISLNALIAEKLAQSVRKII